VLCGRGKFNIGENDEGAPASRKPAAHPEYAANANARPTGRQYRGQKHGADHDRENRVTGRSHRTVGKVSGACRDLDGASHLARDASATKARRNGGEEFPFHHDGSPQAPSRLSPRQRPCIAIRSDRHLAGIRDKNFSLRTNLGQAGHSRNYTLGSGFGDLLSLLRLGIVTPSCN
jgi:hypothetical protein